MTPLPIQTNISTRIFKTTKYILHQTQNKKKDKKQLINEIITTTTNKHPISSLHQQFEHFDQENKTNTSSREKDLKTNTDREI